MLHLGKRFMEVHVDSTAGQSLQASSHQSELAETSAELSSLELSTYGKTCEASARPDAPHPQSPTFVQMYNFEYPSVETGGGLQEAELADQGAEPSSPELSTYGTKTDPAPEVAPLCSDCFELPADGNICVGCAEAESVKFPIIIEKDTQGSDVPTSRSLPALALYARTKLSRDIRDNRCKQCAASSPLPLLGLVWQSGSLRVICQCRPPPQGRKGPSRPRKGKK
jgi:hypothetical protein